MSSNKKDVPKNNNNLHYLQTDQNNSNSNSPTDLNTIKVKPKNLNNKTSKNFFLLIHHPLHSLLLLFPPQINLLGQDQAKLVTGVGLKRLDAILKNLIAVHVFPLDSNASSQINC